MKRDHYATLGVDRSADAGTIKKAFRKKAKGAHPDHGGKNDEFLALQRAYRTLGDEKARAHYDETGRDMDDRQEDRAESQLVGLFLKVIAGAPCVDGLDLVKLVGEEIQLIEMQLEIELRKLPERAAKVREAIARIVLSGDSDNFVAKGLEAAAAGLEASAQTFQSQMELTKEMKHLLESYRYKFEEQKAPQGFRGPLMEFLSQALGRMAERREEEERRERDPRERDERRRPGFTPPWMRPENY